MQKPLETQGDIVTTLVKLAKALLIAGTAALAVLAVLVVILLAWLSSLDLDASSFQFG